jgi:uncharacterized short protein YbdD (DUF466 family)
MRRSEAIERARRLLAAGSRALRGVLGFPDYEAYLEHCRRAGHAPELDERAHFERWLERRGDSPRCC